MSDGPDLAAPLPVRRNSSCSASSFAGSNPPSQPGSQAGAHLAPLKLILKLRPRQLTADELWRRKLELTGRLAGWMQLGRLQPLSGCWLLAAADCGRRASNKPPVGELKLEAAPLGALIAAANRRRAHRPAGWLAAHSKISQPASQPLAGCSRGARQASKSHAPASSHARLAGCSPACLAA